MDNEIEDLVGDVKLTDSQKSVTATNAYSMDFTDSSSDKNNSSGKNTYVLECDDSEDSENYPVHGSKSTIHLNGKYSIQVHNHKDLQHEETHQISRGASTSVHKCSIVAQEIFTQTSKTIIELAETDGVLRKCNNNTLETQTSFISITENKKVEYRIELSGAHNKFSRNEIVHESEHEHDVDKYISHNEVMNNSLDDGSSRFPVSETENYKSDANTSQSSMIDKVILIKYENSKENISSEEQNETIFDNSSDYDSPKFYSDFDEDSLIERHHRKLENIDSQSDTSEVTKSLDNDVAELYSKLSETFELKALERSCDPELLRIGTLTPLTEESTVKKDSLLDIPPKLINLIDDMETETLFTNNAGIKVKVLTQDTKKDKEAFKLPPLQTNQSCPNSPHLNFLFSVHQARPLSKSGTLPSLLEDQRGRWEIGTKDLASGESASINDRSGLVWNNNASVHLPPIHVEGFAVNTPRTYYNVANSTRTTVNAEQRQEAICIKDKIKELKMCCKNTKPISHRNNTESTHSRSESPGSTSINESRFYDVAERGCEALCGELLKRLRSHSWFEVTDTLDEIPKALEKFWGVIPEHRIADLIRQVSGHIESPRTVVTRAACSTLASILKNTNYTKKPDFYEAMTMLLIKTGSFSRPVRRAANVALDDVVCGVELSHAVTALSIHGTSHKSALVRCAAARLLVVCCALAGGGRELLKARPPSAANARKHALRSLATLLEDKSIDTRKYAERLYTMLRPLANFEAYYLTDVDVELASRQMKKYDQMLCSQETR